MRKTLALIACLLSPALYGADGSISTVAGASTVDGVLATATLVNYPGGIAADGVGNVYISDTGNHRIRRVDGGTGIISTIAGTGVRGFTGDFGPSVSAQLDTPGGLSYVNNGSSAFLYVADTGNQRVRRIDLSTGLIQTICGTGLAAYNGDLGLALFASLNNPKGLFANAAGDVYIADTNNHRIRKIDGTLGSITTVAGTGDPSGALGDGGQALAASLSSPETCLIGPSGLLYVADTQHFRIRSVDLGTKVINTYAGNGTQGYTASYTASASSMFGLIKGLYADTTYLFIADSNNHRIRYCTASYVADWFGTGSPGYSGDGGPYSSATINNPGALTVDANFNVVFVDYGNNCVRKVDNTVTYTIFTIAGSGIQDGVKGTNVVLKDPSRVSSGPGGKLLVAESGALKVRSVDLGSGIISTLAGNGSSGYTAEATTATVASNVTFYGVKALAHDRINDRVYVADNYSYVSLIWGSTTICLPFIGCISFPIVIGSGTFGESRIRRIDSAGYITTVAGVNILGNTGNGAQARLAQLGIVEGLALSGTAGAQTLFLSDSYTHLLRRVNLATGVISSMGGLSGTAGYQGDNGPVSGAYFSSPKGLATDSAGNLYIADSGNHAIRKVSAGSLSITTIAGLGPTHPGYSGDGTSATAAGLFNPSDVYCDSANNLYIADSGNHRIRRIDAATGVISTVVGNGFQGFSGDLGPALASTLNSPSGVYVDPSGSIYAADFGNDRVRKVSYAQSPSPTPVVTGANKVVAYPSPASSRICFSYVAPQDGKLLITVYNVAMEVVARIEDRSIGGRANLCCADIAGLAPGAYLYKLDTPGGSFGVGKFKVAR